MQPLLGNQDTEHKSLFEVIHPKEPQPSPRSGWFSWNLVQSVVESDFFSTSYESSVKQLLYPVLCPQGHQIPLRSLVPGPGSLISPTGLPVCTCKARTLKARDSTPQQIRVAKLWKWVIILALMTENAGRFSLHTCLRLLNSLLFFRPSFPSCSQYR